MLTTLSVRHFAVVEEVEVDFRSGLTVVTGETGAGKSLLVDALMLLSGARADTGMIRAGAGRAELHASFDLEHLESARRWLEEQELDDGDTCQLRRVLKSDGRSRAWINGRSATIAQLSELAPLMLEVHGQHEHQALLSRQHQLGLLDAFAGHADVLDAIRACATRWREVGTRQRALAGGGDPQEKIELLRHELDQLQQWALEPEALAELESEHRRLANADRLLEGCQGLLALLDAGGDGDMALDAMLSRTQTELERLTALDSRLQPALDLVSAAGIQLGEAGDALNHYAQDLDMDPARYAEADAHLSHLHELSRRHRVAPEALKATAAEIRSELDELENAGATLEKLAAERERLAVEYATLADKLGEARRRAADALGRKVTGLMQELGMRGGRFEIRLDPRDRDDPDPQGRERAEFLVSANPGQPPRALRKVASGGELARIGLAIEVAALGADEVGTMVFDEVDTGIGGAVAEVVGQKLRALGTHCQVLCVTHLAQVAAQGHAHLKVSKHNDGAHTTTVLATLDDAARGEELARMLGGIDITPETRAHARKMLELAQG